MRAKEGTIVLAILLSVLVARPGHPLLMPPKEITCTLGSPEEDTKTLRCFIILWIVRHTIKLSQKKTLSLLYEVIPPFLSHKPQLHPGWGLDPPGERDRGWP